MFFNTGKSCGDLCDLHGLLWNLAQGNSAQGNGKNLVIFIIYQENSMCVFLGRAKFLECLCHGSG